MNLLLDTHAWLWWTLDDAALSQRAREAIDDPANRVIFSAASAWEITIKYAIGKITLAEPPDTFLPKILNQQDVEILNITVEHASAIHKLPLHHRDPFDRLLVAQALCERATFVTSDPLIDAYTIQTLW